MEIDKIKRVAQGLASMQEEEEVKLWVAASEERSRFLEDARVFYAKEKIDDNFSNKRERDKAMPALGKRHGIGRGWMAIAASVAIIVGIFWGLDLFKTDDSVLSQSVLAHSTAIQLILPDGSVHEFSAEKKSSVRIPGFQFVKTGSIQQESTVADSLQVTATEYNEIIVPRGGEYLLTLTDGTEIMLNSETKIKFPSSFSGTERRVFLDGEAYFSVTRNENKPFLVSVYGGEIQVLGTQFNVKAYQGHNIFTTLVSGSVKVSTERDSLVLQPGQLCEMDVERHTLAVQDADLLSVLAWKNGEFVFKDVTLEFVMNELARWYDTEIDYDSVELKDRRLHIYMDRTKTLEEALQIIAQVGSITYRVEGRKIKVSNK